MWVERSVQCCQTVIVYFPYTSHINSAWFHSVFLLMIIQRRIQATGRVFNTHCKGFSFFGRCRQQGRPVEAMQGRERTKTPWHTNKSKTDDEFIFIYMKKDLDCTVPSQILDVIIYILLIKISLLCPYLNLSAKWSQLAWMFCTKQFWF